MGTRKPGAANKTYTRPLDKRTRRSKAQGVRAACGRKKQGQVRGAGSARGMEEALDKGTRRSKGPREHAGSQGQRARAEVQGSARA